MNRLVFIKAETTKDGTRIYLLPLSTIKQINFTDSEAELSVWDRDMKEIKTTVGVTNDGTYISLGLDALRSIGDGIFALSLNLKLEGESQDYPDKEYFYIKLKHDDQHVILENVWTREKPYNMFQDSTDNGNGKGKDGKSAYAIWLDNGYTGTEIDFLNWLQGPQGDPGPQGYSGANFYYSTYEAQPNQNNLYWTDLHPTANPPRVGEHVIVPSGKVYEITGIDTTVDPHTYAIGEQLADIKGNTGPQGPVGPKGDQGVAGKDGHSIWQNTKSYGPNGTQRWFIDLVNASASNPPKVNDIMIDSDGNMAMITKVDITNNDNRGGGTFDYGPWIGNIKGPKGDKGDDAVINVISQANYDALSDKSGVYFIEG